MTVRGILTVDEGTTGTRATIVDEFGKAHELFYERLRITSPRPGVVEQDAKEILDRTLLAMRRAVRYAENNDIEVVGVGIATQRATATLWDAVTGEPFGLSVVWQDSRYSDLLATYENEWDDKLVDVTGRPVGVRSQYLWAAKRIQNEPELSQALKEGRLRFGTVDTWLLWNLSGGRANLTSATNAVPCGATDIREFRYFEPWLEFLDFPTVLLPTLVDDGLPEGLVEVELDGKMYPLLSLIGDQHASMIGLGATNPGSTMVMHGTGSFVDLVVGPQFPPPKKGYDGTLNLIGWRSEQKTTYSVETFTAATGSAVDFLCEQLGWFEDAAEISAVSKQVDHAHGVTFLPTLTGIRSPQMNTKVRGGLDGISTATTKEHVAYAILEGVAQFVAQSLEANSEVAELETHAVNVGGGLSRADSLIQIQADLAGKPMRRHAKADLATLKGAAFLGAGRGLFWDSLEEATATLAPGDVFEPQISEDERLTRRQQWRDRISLEIRLEEGKGNETTDSPNGNR